jgi:hypothetical protein
VNLGGKVARIGPEQYNGMKTLRQSLEKTGFPPPRLEYLLKQQGIDLSAKLVFSMRSGTDYLYCNAEDDDEAQALFSQHLGQP